MRPYYYGLKDLIYKHNDRFLNKNHSLKDKYIGKRVFLLLSGESLSNIDIPRLKSEYTFGLGFLFLHKEIVDLPLTFFQGIEGKAKLDKPFAHGSHNWPENLILSGYINQFYVALREIVINFLRKGTIIFLNAESIKYFKKLNLFNIDHENIFYVKYMGGLHSDMFPRLDLTKRFVGGSAGIIDSILILIFMGFKEIYLCGAGYTYRPLYMLHFYDNHVFPITMSKERAILEAKNVVIPHNKKWNSNIKYYGIWEKDNLYRGIYTGEFCENAPDIIKHKKINDYAKSLGIRILNIVPDKFESPIYEKITWEEVVGNVLPNPQIRSDNRR